MDKILKSSDWENFNDCNPKSQMYKLSLLIKIELKLKLPCCIWYFYICLKDSAIYFKNKTTCLLSRPFL